MATPKIPLPDSLEPRCAACSRRTFLGRLAVLAVGSAALRQTGCGGTPGVGASTLSGNSLIVALGDPANQPLTSVNGAVLVAAPADTIVVIRTGTSTVSALSALCTHAGCTVGFDATLKRLQCPCHGSTFSETGAVLGGPAPAPLHDYPATLSATQVTIRLA